MRNFFSGFNARFSPFQQIDDNRRIQLNRDRMLAIEIERRLHFKRQEKLIETEMDGSNNITASDIDETLVKGAVEHNLSNYDTSAAVDSLLDDNSSTLKEDAINTIVQTSSNIEITKEPKMDDISDHLEPIEIPALTLTIDTNLFPFDTDNLSPSFSLHSSPSLGALNDSRNQSLYFTPMSGRESFSPISNQADHFPVPRLIRSNSYTLDKPSPMLLQHMENKGVRVGGGVTSSPVKNPRSMNEFRQNSKNITNKMSRKSLGPDVGGHAAKDLKAKYGLCKTAKTSRHSISAYSVPAHKPTTNKTSKLPNSTQKEKHPNQFGVLKKNETNIRSTGEPSKPVKVHSSARKVGDAATPIVSNRNGSKVIHGTNSSPINASNGNLDVRNYEDILAIIERQHTAQMELLLQRQQAEQKRMQEEFLRQQEELLKKFATLVSIRKENAVTPNEIAPKSVEAKKTNEKMLMDEVNSQVPVSLDSNGNRVSRFTPENARCIRRLYYDDKKSVFDELDKSTASSQSTVTSEQSEMYGDREVKAVTTIAAYMRGYLTRRLFKTTKVQDVVKTFRDTLLFVLDLHYEKPGDESAADVELKYHLIQQV